MFSHQISNSIGSEIYNAYCYRNIEFVLHLHKAFELLYVIDGTVNATVGEVEYSLKKGDFLLVPPFVLHSYTAAAFSLSSVAVFSESYVPTAAKLFAESVPENYVISLPPETEKYIAKNLFFDTRPDEKPVAIEKPEIFAIKASLYAFFDAFLKEKEMQKKHRNETLIFRTIQYFEKNFTQTVSLQTLARELGYNYEYLSRSFHRLFGIRFDRLLAQYRAEQAATLMRETSLSLADIAMNSGFQSIRTFNRVFKDLYGISPSEYRKKEKSK